MYQWCERRAPHAANNWDRIREQLSVLPCFESGPKGQWTFSQTGLCHECVGRAAATNQKSGELQELIQDCLASLSIHKLSTLARSQSGGSS